MSGAIDWEARARAAEVRVAELEATQCESCRASQTAQRDVVQREAQGLEGARQPERCLLCGERTEGHRSCDDEHDDGTEGPCGAPGPHGRFCTRADDHASLLHAAHDENGAVVDVWSDVASIGDEGRLLAGELATLRGEVLGLREQTETLRAEKQRFERGYFEAHRRIDVEVATRQDAEGRLARCLSLVLPLDEARSPGKYDAGFALLHDAVKGRVVPSLVPPWLEIHPLADGSTLVRVAGAWRRVEESPRYPGMWRTEILTEESARALLVDNSAEGRQ